MWLKDLGKLVKDFPCGLVSKDKKMLNSAILVF